MTILPQCWFPLVCILIPLLALTTFGSLWWGLPRFYFCIYTYEQTFPNALNCASHLESFSWACPQVSFSRVSFFTLFPLVTEFANLRECAFALYRIHLCCWPICSKHAWPPPDLTLSTNQILTLCSGFMLSSSYRWWWPLAILPPFNTIHASARFNQWWVTDCSLWKASGTIYCQVQHLENWSTY